ncbi:hypothetical protein [Pseudomonas helleri]|uniref:Uncharacterized protein n=1 Tax=Pseudomonas helleri TaxID=1608996 RepID=A0A6L5HUN2_9PSED|nr:hypothetical protein [Pseudomonas helleri]MQU06980.1 hypothetical protein [Pseudomonas helleri]
MSQATPTPPSPFSAIRLVSYSAGFGSALALIGAALPLLQNFSSFKVVDIESYVPLREVSDNYYSKSFVEAHYLYKSDVANDYLKKEEVEQRLSGLISPDKIKSDYVPRSDYDTLQRSSEALTIQLHEIPTPFKTRKKMLSESGEWNDSQLGLSISVKKFTQWNADSYTALITLSLPDAPLHYEPLRSGELDRCKWTFIKNNREFELKVETFDPFVFVVEEIY